MVGRGVVGPFDGDLDDYQRYLLEESKRLREEAKQAEQAQINAAKSQPAVAAPVAVATPVVQAPQGDQRELRKQAAAARQQLAEKTKPYKKELDKVDQRVAALSAEKAELETQLATPLTPAEIAEAGKRLKAVSDELDTLEERWLELSETIESLTQAMGLA